MKNKKEAERLTIEEYQAKYSKLENGKKFSAYVHLGATIICLLTLAALFSIFKTAYDFNKYLGYGVGGVSLVLFVIFILIPIIKIIRANRFETEVNVISILRAQKHNAVVRKKLADQIINLHGSTKKETGWYSEEKIQKLIDAGSDKEQIKSALNDLYATDIKKKGKDLIFKASLKAGLYSAISQSNLTDSLVVGAVNLQMVKNVIYLYGFRPSDKKLAKIFTTVISNSLLAYGVADVKIGNGVASMIGGAAKGIPLLGSVVSVLVDSSVQGLANAVLTAIIGNSTLKYLIEEYKLQNVIDSIEVPTKEDFADVYNQLKKELSSKKSKPITA